MGPVATTALFVATALAPSGVAAWHEPAFCKSLDCPQFSSVLANATEHFEVRDYQSVRAAYTEGNLPPRGGRQWRGGGVHWGRVGVNPSRSSGSFAPRPGPAPAPLPTHRTHCS